jgi:UDP-N-acetyl-D-glucosamine dehydrogenase
MELTLKALKDSGKKIENSQITVLGSAYKADIDDPRLSPSEPIIKELLKLGAKTTVYDPHCNASFGAKKKQNPSMKQQKALTA